MRHDIPIVMGDYQADQFGNVKLFAELVRRKDGKWFLMATVEHEPEPPCDTNDFLGVTLALRISPRTRMARCTLAKRWRPCASRI